MKKYKSFNDITDKGNELYESAKNTDHKDMIEFMEQSLTQLDLLSRKVFGLEQSVKNYQAKEYRYKKSL